MRQPTAPRSHKLDNGVVVICDAAPGFETLAVSVVAGRGARFENEARSGWSHLLEHMVFKGAGRRSAREIVEAVESQGGHINAATGHERTSFQVRALEGGLTLALEVTSDLLLRPILDDDDLAREKRVIGQEIAEAADTPDDQVFELAQAAAFAGQPLGRPVLGTPSSIGAATPKTLKAWRGALYAPDRVVVAAAGAVEEDILLKLTEDRFGGVEPVAGPEAPAATFTRGAASESRRLEQAHIVLALPAPGVTDEEHFAFRLFAEMLGGGMSSRLFQEARERLGLAYAIDAFAEAYIDAGVLGVYAGCAPKDAGRLAEVVGAEILSLAKAATEPELARAKAQLKGALFMSRESLVARAEQAAAQWLTFGRLVSAREIGARIDAVSKGDVARVAGRILAPALSVGAVLGPKRAMDAPDRFEAALFG